MKRRQFIYLSGSSLAALIFAPPVFGNKKNFYTLDWPTGAAIQTGGQWIKLESSGNEKWTHKDVVVTLSQKDGAMPVVISSPTIPLDAVKLEWPIEEKHSSTYLGDQWERTYGDVGWSGFGDEKMPWYFMQYDGTSTNCFGVKTGCNTICYWAIKNGVLELTLNTGSGGTGVQLGQRSLHAADIITTRSTDGESPFETGKRFCAAMCPSPRLPKLPVYGINDWYFAYGNNSSELILKHTSLLTGLATDNGNRPFSVIDDGWAARAPLSFNADNWEDDYSRSNEKFPDMQKLAGDIKKLGMRPGLWMRPLSARHDDKASLLLPHIPGRESPKEPVLDPTIPENIERIKHNISLYKNWGMELVKHDYSTYDIMGKWGAKMSDSITTPGWNFYDRSKTNAEVMLHLYNSIREAAGDMYLIGCNTMSHLSAGIFELNRIGDDTSGNEWERTPKMGVNTLAFRAIQHNHFYAVDPDCVGLTTKIAWSRNKQWMNLVAHSGTPLFISAQPEALGAEQKKFIRECFTAAAKPQPVAEPLDWIENKAPKKWKLDNEVVVFDWA